jgi:hypothetical protein
MGKQALPFVAQGKARVDDDPPVGNGYLATEAPDAQGFGTDNFSFH